jgi:hypothetical protein
VKPYRLTIYRRFKRPPPLGGPAVAQFFWRLQSKNGRILADGSEAYSSKATARRAVKTLPLSFGEIEVAIDDGGPAR